MDTRTEIIKEDTQIDVVAGMGVIKEMVLMRLEQSLMMHGKRSRVQAVFF